MQPASFQAKRVSQGVVSFLKKHNQLHLLPQVAQDALKVSRAQTDPSIAHITSAIPLPDNLQNQLRLSLESLYGRPLTLNLTQDPNLIGGLRIKVGDQVIDQSLNYQIDQLVNQIDL